MIKPTQCCANEFQPVLFGLNYQHTSDFVTCQWQTQLSMRYVYYRYIHAGYFITTLFANIITSAVRGRAGKWFIYLTHWGYVMCTLQALCAAYMVTRKMQQTRRDPAAVSKTTEMPMPLLYKIYWMCHSVSVVMAFSITGAFWVAVYDPKIHTLNTFSLISHVFNSMFMGVDFLLVRHPIRLLHFYFSVLFTALFVAFSFVHYHVGGLNLENKSYIYSVLQWKDVVRASVASCAGLLFVLVMHVVVWGFFLQRRWIHDRYCRVEEDDEEKTNSESLYHSTFAVEFTDEIL